MTVIICPACNTRFETAAVIPPTGRKVRCSKCGNVWQAIAVTEAAKPTVITAPTPPPVAAAPEPAAPQPAKPPAIEHPIPEAPPPEKPLPPLAESDSAAHDAVTRLFGSETAAKAFNTDALIRRFVVTVDNLPRKTTSARLMPVKPVPGPFAVEGNGADATIGPQNALRYRPYIVAMEGVEAKRLVATYVQLYPLFQAAYEELGYPGKYFNDRLVAVIDHLLAAPEPQGPLAIRVVEVKGEVPSEKPWVRYEYADPKLESLSAGQKLMVRVGLDNERRLKARLRELRSQVATARPGAPSRP